MANYLQVQLGGKSRGWKFNQEAFEIFLKKINWTDPNGASDTYACFYAGLVACCRVKCEAVDFTFENVCDWCDDLSAEEKKKVMDAMGEENRYRVWMDEFKEKVRLLAKTEENEEVKKKHKVK